MAMSRLSKLYCLSKEHKKCSSMLLRGFITMQNINSYNMISKLNDYQYRFYATLPNANQQYEWKMLFQDAQNSVGYPTSYENLRWLLSDKFASVGQQLRKLAASKNTLQKTAKIAAAQLVNINGNNGDVSLLQRHILQDFGLIILLLSKSTGLSSNVKYAPEEIDSSSGVLYTQRALAEITEMIRASHLVHQGMVNMQPMSEVGQNFAIHGEVSSGNKIVLLSGDYLLGSSCYALAKLRNQDLNEILSSTLRDMSESEFIGDRDEQNHPLPSPPSKSQHRSLLTEDVDDEYRRHLHDDVIKPIEKDRFLGSPESEWALRHMLKVGSLLGKGCLGALKLAELPDDIQKDGFWFGKSFALTWQACSDLEPFRNKELYNGETFSLVSSPVLYHLEYDSKIYEIIQKGRISIENVDYKLLYNEICKGPAIDKSTKLLQKQAKFTLQMLQKFPSCDSTKYLRNMILAMLA